MAIEMRHGHTALVDLEDWPIVAAFGWYARRGQKGGLYAVSNQKVRGNHQSQYTLRMHRLLTNPPPGQDVDHRNGDGLDNRRSNLRPCTNPENQQNTGPRGGASRFKGVSWDRRKQKWRVAFRALGEHRFVGNFSDEEDAARAYDAAILRICPEFARLNFPHGAGDGIGTEMRARGAKSAKLT